ncbi:hypothetical protein J6590_010943 [Homalodisca vitripennis]|nr:hypothetical protein J6590_010943 [Homalodisca vitripennis]
MVTIFWARKSVLLRDFLPQEITIDAERYCEMVLKRRPAIHNHRRGLLSSGVVLHDNVRPHVTVITQTQLDNTITLLSFSITHQEISWRQALENDATLKETVTNWFNGYAAVFFDDGIQKLEPRLEECLNTAMGNERSKASVISPRRGKGVSGRRD